MSEEQPAKSIDGQIALGQVVGAKAARKLKAQNKSSNVWSGLGMTGLIGWAVVVPTLGGAALGIWLDSHHPGVHSWTLTMLITGLAIGCLNAWHWVSLEGKAMQNEPENNDE